MSTIAIIQARTGSSRLPNKVLRILGHQTMLDWVVERVRGAKRVDEIVIATTDQPQDDSLVEFVRARGWNCYRGSEQDVLSRYKEAARAFGAEFIVRITSDCPFIDASLIDRVVACVHADSQVDYACNFFPKRHFPRGLDVECLPISTLERVDQLAAAVDLREHVTLSIYQNPEAFLISGVVHDVDLSAHRWTVDTVEDFRFAKTVAQYFGRTSFSWLELLEAVRRHPDWSQLNEHVRQKATANSDGN